MILSSRSASTEPLSAHFRVWTRQAWGVRLLSPVDRIRLGCQGGLITMASEPITQRISSDLRRQIHEGTLGPGALLPSEPEVARAYGVSRQTARSALQALEREGLVIVRPRRGRMVRSNQRLRWHLSEFERPDRT